MGTESFEIQKSIDHYLNSLNNWLENNGWSGWDPYDIWDNKFGIWLSKDENIIQRGANVLVTYAEEIFPIMLRKILRVEPRINAKAMGLYAAGFLNLEALEGKPHYIKGEPAYEYCFRWLEDNKVDRFGGWGWGYPFDWRTRTLIPKGTPTVVNSSIIGDAFWLKYKYHGDKKALWVCEQICLFFLNGLNRTGYNKDKSLFCFSYTPVDTFQVHNANLFGAEFLVRIGKETGHDDWVRTGLEAASFSLAEVREDGTLNYWSNGQASELQQDTYHSGFEIRAIDSIASLTGLKEYREAANKYFSTWLKDFFSEKGAPYFVRNNKNSLEVHSCAEGLLCAVKLYSSGNYSKGLFLDHIRKVLMAISKLWVNTKGNEGYFISKTQKRYGIEFKVDIPYIRWGEAWMFNALTMIKAVDKFQE